MYVFYVYLKFELVKYTLNTYMKGRLSNLGATCAINTIIQLIAYSTTLRTLLLKIYEMIKDSQGLHHTMTYQLGDVIHKIYNEDCIVYPEGLTNIIYAHFQGLIRRGEQCDICELWVLIAERIASELGVPMGEGNPDNANGPEHEIFQALRKHNNNQISMWLIAIQTVQVSIVQCITCQDQPWNTETFTTFDVHVPHELGKKVLSLEELMVQNYSIEEMLDWKCDKCNNTGAKKQNKPFRLPKVLVVSLKRFHMSHEGHISKTTTPILLRNDLVFSLQDTKVVYNIVGVGNHYGSYTGGHYTAYVKDGDTWFCYDDARRSPINPNEFLMKNSDAYILFYEQIQK